MDACGDYRRPSHGFALEEGTFGFGAKAAILLQIIRQGGIGGAGGRFFRNAEQGREVAHMRRVAVVSEGKHMETNRLVAFGDGGDGLHVGFQGLQGGHVGDLYHEIGQTRVRDLDG